jgi:carbonic anhydrase
MAEGKFGTVLNCMDGRTQLQVNEYLRKTYNLDYVDTITEPGPVKILAEKQPGVDSILSRVNISVGGHGSRLIAIVAHHDCAGKPVPKETQLEQLKQAKETVLGWNLGVECLCLWVGDDWQVEAV